MSAPIAAAADFQHALIIIADDLGTDKVSGYAADVDNPTETRPSTPNVDLLGTVGVRFTDAWATPTCSPTRAMLLAGEWPSRNGVGGVLSNSTTAKLETTPDTLAQLAEDAGVATALFGKAHIGTGTLTPQRPTTTDLDYAEYPVQVGFSWFQGNTDGQLTSYARWLYMQSVPSATMTSGYVTTATTVTTRSPTAQSTIDALAWLDDRSAEGARRLAVVSYHLPHSSGAVTSASWSEALTSCGGSPGSDQTDNQRRVVECLDDELALLLAGVPDLADTLVVFLGDNGTPDAVAEGNFDDSRGKSTVYESGVRVPFAIADGEALQDALDNGGVLPTGGTYRVEAGVTAMEAATVVDVYATVADLLDLSSTGCTVGDTCARDSISLRPVLEGGSTDRAYTWTELFDIEGTTQVSGAGAVRIGDLKLKVNVSSETTPCRTYTLYDLSADRWESYDRFDDLGYATEQAELLAALEEIAAATGSAWLAHADCDACDATETWYDDFDSSCDTDSDFDQDGDGVDWPDDCLDTDPGAYPGAGDVWYDGVDSDCGGEDDYDQDGDGAETPTDCDDTDPGLHPGAVDTWYDGVDTDCGGENDYDQDGDTFDADGDCDDTRGDVFPGALETPYDGVDADCLEDSDFDADGDGIDAKDWGGTDCDDADALIWPGAPEASGDGIDSDCDGVVEAHDADGDGAETGLDCDDADPTVYPGAEDLPYDGIDQDCTGGDLTDVDGDGYASAKAGRSDCDDDDARVNPGATEVWYDGADANCDGADDYDADADGYPPLRYGGTDCDDANRRIRPGARETWYDGVDQNCDNADDFDRDGDGHRALSYGGDDCDDTRAAVVPGATEIWYDGTDQNCDGADDYDRDGDGWPRGTDCNDGAARVYPGAPGWTLACTRTG